MLMSSGNSDMPPEVAPLTELEFRVLCLPAVLGTGNSTRRIVSGQRITVDGDAGVVTIEDTSLGVQV